MFASAGGIRTTEAEPAYYDGICTTRIQRQTEHPSSLSKTYASPSNIYPSPHHDQHLQLSNMQILTTTIVVTAALLGFAQPVLSSPVKLVPATTLPLRSTSPITAVRENLPRDLEVVSGTLPGGLDESMIIRPNGDIPTPWSGHGACCVDCVKVCRKKTKFCDRLRCERADLVSVLVMFTWERG